MVEWSITAVLKTAVLRGTGGSNPSLSAESCKSKDLQDFSLYARHFLSSLLLETSSLKAIWQSSHIMYSHPCFVLKHKNPTLASIAKVGFPTLTPSVWRTFIIKFFRQGYNELCVHCGRPCHPVCKRWLSQAPYRGASDGLSHCCGNSGSTCRYSPR